MVIIAFINLIVFIFDATSLLLTFKLNKCFFFNDLFCYRIPSNYVTYTYEQRKFVIIIIVIAVVVDAKLRN